MNFCSHCGSRVDQLVPPGDDRPRHVCTHCRTVHYQNPKVVVGCIPEWQDRILLCRRSIEPRSGLWTVPAGFLENGETVSEGAKREALEEALARVETLSLYTLFDLVHANQVYLIFRSRLLEPSYGPGKESLEVRLFLEKDIPWDEIAFTSITECLRLYFGDRPSGIFPLHIGRIPPPQSTSSSG